LPVRMWLRVSRFHIFLPLPFHLTTSDRVVETLVQKLHARAGLLTIAEVMRMAKVRFQTGWIGLSAHI
jgi:hypothetical protein